ncbi:MAG TPA: hypothetical protein VN763_09580, partial [Saprospiraceae bacterium]|nr:hypothetical protein [Saprospiraceae bacterium]
LQFKLDFVTRKARRALQLIRKFTLNIAYWQEKPSVFPLQKTETFIRRNAVYPGKQLGIFPKSIDMAVDFDENFLGQVVSVIMVDYHFPGMPINALLIFANE